MTPRPRVLLSERIGDSGMGLLEAEADVVVASSADPAVLAREVEGADALIVRSTQVPAFVLEAGSGLRVLGRHGAGVENLDVAAASRLGIRVVNTPGANAASVAEFVLLAALILSRRPEAARRALAAGDLSHDGSLPGAVQRAGHGGRSLVGRRMGIVGFGAIGRHVHTMARGFGMEVLMHDPFVSEVPEDVTPLDLDDLLTLSDVLTLHVPQTEGTLHLLDARRIALLPPGALVVNTARAGIVDAGAIIAALDAGRLGGYAVDVFDPEPPLIDDPLLHHPRVLATPHMAAMTDGALDEMARRVATGVLLALAEDQQLTNAGGEHR